MADWADEKEMALWDAWLHHAKYERPDFATALRQARIDALEEAARHVEAKHGYGMALQIAAEIRTLKVKE